jgi:hypothetical protein
MQKNLSTVINNKSLLVYRHMCMPVWKAHKCRIEKPSNSFSPSFNITIVTNKQKIQLVHLEKGQYALIQSLFFEPIKVIKNQKNLTTMRMKN